MTTRSTGTRPSANSRGVRFVVVGNPENRRVTLFGEALREAGLPPPEVVPWLEVVRDPARMRAVDGGPALVRIDACGEDFAVERELLARGGFAEAFTIEERRGEVIAPAVAHRGFLQVLGELAAVFAERPAWRVLNPPHEIAELFDKARTSRRYRAHGLPVPEFLEEVPRAAADLLEACRARGWKQVFVKPTMGSSASGVLLVSIGRKGAVIRTSLEWDPPRWYNNLRLSSYQTAADVSRALEFVLAQGAQVERAIPKARLDGAYFDCRVLCIAGEPRFVVVRQNQHPITNLHLGGFRGSVEALRAALAPGAWEAMLSTCRGVAALYRSLHVGLDVLFEEDFDHHRVIEANAFGDLLPNLTLEGRSVYRLEIDEALRCRGMDASTLT
ncbi:MAG: STM4014 family protein [Myxococcales bacterium]|nr:STM4014 family protein [Myxococcales bacterium]